MIFPTALIVLAAVAAPPGASNADEGALKHAISAFDEADFDRCLSATEETLAVACSDATAAQLYLVRGRCFAALQRFDKVEEAFTRALGRDPEVTLDPKRVLPTLVILLDSLRVRLRGTLRVLAAGASSVFVDGYAMGPTPLTTALPIGRHHVKVVSAAEDASGEGDAMVRPSQTTSLQITLKPNPPPPVVAEPLLAAKPDPLQLDVDVIAAFDPINGFGAAGGPSLRGSYWIVALHGGGGLFPAADAEVGFRAPRFVGPVGLFVMGEGQVVFASTPVTALGGGGGIMVSGGKDFEVFVEAGARASLSGPTPSNALTLAAGVRIRAL